MDNLITKVITIAKVEELDGRKVLHDIPADGSQYGTRYTVWQRKQDGSETVAWGQLKSFNVGERVGIHYDEKPGVNRATGKEITYRTIREFVPTGVAEPAAKTPAQTAPRYIPKSQREERPDWDAIAEGKVRHGFAIEAFKLGMELDGETKLKIGRWVRFVMDGDFTSTSKQAPTEVEPNSDEEINVETLPF